MTRKSNLFINQPANKPKTFENKSNGEQAEKVSDNNRLKKKKKKSKNNQQELFKARKASETNHQANNVIQTFNDNDSKLGEKNDDDSNFNLVRIAQEKNIKFNNSIEVQTSDQIEKKPYVFKKWSAGLSEKQYNNERLKSNCFNHASKKQNYTEFRKHDHAKNDQINYQFKNEKFNEKSEKHKKIDEYLNDRDKVNQSSSSFFLKSQNNTKELPSGKYDYIKTMNTIREDQLTESRSYQKEPEQKYKNQNIINTHDNRHWDFNSHSGQYTYTINNDTMSIAKHSSQSEHLKNEGKIVLESFQNDNFENSSIFRGVDFSDSDITKNQRLNTDVVNINFNRLYKSSDSTFIHTNQEQLKFNKHEVSTPKFTVQMLPHIYSHQNNFKTNDERSSTFYEHNKLEESISNKNDLRCEEIINDHTKENVHRITQINSNINHKKSNNYPSIESYENNFSNKQTTCNVTNLNSFIEHFNELWEDVIQVMSGY